MFIKQCHGASLVGFQLKSMIKSNGTYAVHGAYYPLPKGRQLADSEDEVLSFVASLVGERLLVEQQGQSMQRKEAEKVKEATLSLLCENA